MFYGKIKLYRLFGGTILMTKERLIERKLEFLDWELGVFFHFGIRTFYEGHIDWDLKPMPAEA